MLLLVHHGEAVDPAVDFQRPLSPRGRQLAEALAAACAARGVRPAAIWHSGKLRARQTAEAFWRACNPVAEFSAVPGLRPSDPPEATRDVLTGDERTLILVGHMPHLERLRQLLVAEEAGSAAFPAHGVVALEATPASRWAECWRLGVPDVDPLGEGDEARR
jgi:phosphohistidine phosphatase